MKKRNIIRKDYEYTEIINKSSYVKNDYFIIYYRENNDKNRYGISVPKKTGKANIRNKIKRRIKNIIDLNEKKVHNSFDYVIIVRKRLIELNYKDMEYHLITLFEKIGEKYEEKKF